MKLEIEVPDSIIAMMRARWISEEQFIDWKLYDREKYGKLTSEKTHDEFVEEVKEWIVDYIKDCWED